MAKEEKQLTGRHVLYMLLAFFGVMIAVNIYFTVVAVKSFRGEDVPRSYRQGLEYNQTLAERAEQDRSGWSAAVNMVDTDKEAFRLIVEFKDKDNRPVSGLALKAKLRHPVDTDFDAPLTFNHLGNGRYVSALLPFKGTRTLEADAYKGEFVFKIRHELWHD